MKQDVEEAIMKLRDKRNTEERYLDNINYYKRTIDNWNREIEELKQSELQGIQMHPNVTNMEVIEGFQRSIFLNRISLLLATYSVGMEIGEVKSEYLKSIEALFHTNKNLNTDYASFLWLLSIAIIFDMEDEVFYRLGDRIKQDKLNDYLVDFLMHSRISSWERNNETFLWKRPYAFLEQVITSAESGDLKRSETLLLEYLKKKWYRGNSDEVWYNDHIVTEKSKDFPHDGYWSFESGALVKIFKLEDSDWKELQYYPYDMLHHEFV
ncbi:DUF1911 domain-containing protein [Clostridiales bacterium COT073_COT-073]|nr:DUF1911 domain-containing protein [Clostridiales bacterium COT073_COT-073]